VSGVPAARQRAGGTVPPPRQATAPDAAGTARRTPHVSAAWLELREPADAAARAADLIPRLRPHLPEGRPLVIHDLGCGTGSMGRWLAPRLPGAQHWIMYDKDPELLEHAAARMTGTAADGAPVTVETRRRDITRLTADDLHGAALVTASALLDMLTGAEMARIIAACTGAACPALLTISVIGRVELTPADPLDAEIAEAFNAHQRRFTTGGPLLGPDSVRAAVDGFTRRGAATVVLPSPWRLNGGNAELISEWFRGWVGAACEQRPELAGPAATYTRRRLTQVASGHLCVVVHHQDLLAHPT
jgi:hypothetical protein